MNIEEIKAKVAAYPVGFGALVVAISALALLYFRSDVEASLRAERDLKLKERDAMKMNELNSRRMVDDLQHAKRLYENVTGMALDLNSSIAVQAFLAEFAQNTSIKVGLPRQQAKPMPILSAKAIATCLYSVECEAGYGDLIKYLAGLQANLKRAMVVTRVDIGGERSFDGDSQKSKKSTMPSVVSFRLWGRNEPLSKLASTPDKSVVSISERKRRLAAADSCFSPSTSRMEAVCDPFGLSVPAAESSSGLNPPVGEFDAILGALDFSIITFRGEPAVKIKGIGTKRVNNEFELTSGARSVKFKVASIEADAFYVLTTSGNRIKVTTKK